MAAPMGSSEHIYRRNIIKIVIYLFILLFIPFFGSSPAGQTRRRIFTLDGSNDADSRKGVPFGGFVDTAPHFGVKFPPKTSLGRE